MCFLGYCYQYLSADAGIQIQNVGHKQETLDYKHKVCKQDVGKVI